MSKLDPNIDKIYRVELMKTSYFVLFEDGSAIDVQTYSKSRDKVDTFSHIERHRVEEELEFMEKKIGNHRNGEMKEVTEEETPNKVIEKALHQKKWG